jgi:hypothetical protein
MLSPLWFGKSSVPPDSPGKKELLAPFDPVDAAAEA